jgi:hypothetical protein
MRDKIFELWQQLEYVIIYTCIWKIYIYICVCVSNDTTAPIVPGPPYYRCFTNTLIHTTLGRNPWTSDQPAAEAAAYTRHNTDKRQICTSPAGFEPTIPASERSQAYALDRAANISYYTVVSFMDKCNLLVINLFMPKRSAFFCGVTRRRVAILYRRFGTTYRSHLQGSRSPIKIGPILCP